MDPKYVMPKPKEELPQQACPNTNGACLVDTWLPILGRALVGKIMPTSSNELGRGGKEATQFLDEPLLGQTCAHNIKIT